MIIEHEIRMKTSKVTLGSCRWMEEQLLFIKYLLYLLLYYFATDGEAISCEASVSTITKMVVFCWKGLDTAFSSLKQTQSLVWAFETNLQGQCQLKSKWLSAHMLQGRSMCSQASTALGKMKCSQSFKTFSNWRCIDALPGHIFLGDV